MALSPERRGFISPQEELDRLQEYNAVYLHKMGIVDRAWRSFFKDPMNSYAPGYSEDRMPDPYRPMVSQYTRPTGQTELYITFCIHADEHNLRTLSAIVEPADTEESMNYPGVPRILVGSQEYTMLQAMAADARDIPGISDNLLYIGPNKQC